jgi:hypothetical protein
MAGSARMTVRLDPAVRRKVERLAAREGLSLNEALNRLLHEAPDERGRTPRRRRYRLKPRSVGFGFDIARARSIAAEMVDEQTLHKLGARR